MASDTVGEVNVCVSTADAGRPLKKATTFREWFVKNQIGAYIYHRTLGSIPSSCEGEQLLTS